MHTEGSFVEAGPVPEWSCAVVRMTGFLLEVAAYLLVALEEEE